MMQTVRIPAGQWTGIPALDGQELTIQPTHVGTIVDGWISLRGWVAIPGELQRVQHWVRVSIGAWEAVS
jgi:hypothetical protein